MQTPVVSMQKNSAPAALTEGKAVEVSWCAGNDPIVDDGSDDHGMIDQAIHAAHAKTKASFFINNRFYQQGACVLMSANVGLAGGDDDTPPRKKATKGKGKKAKKGKRRKERS